MKTYKAYSESAYLKKEDFPEPKILTIESVREELVTAPGKPEKLKLVIYFEELEKGLVLNMVNGAVLEAMSGTDDPEQWVGLRVKAFNNPNVVFGNKPVGGIRLKPAVRQAKPHPPVKISQPTADDFDEDKMNAEIDALTR